MLIQINEKGNEHPLAFGSKKLRECNDSAIKREALAIVIRIKHFQKYLEGTKFIVQMDHNPFTKLSTLKNSHGQLARWALALQPLNFSVVHRSGHANANADGLSRDQESLFKGGRDVRHLLSDYY